MGVGAYLSKRVLEVESIWEWGLIRSFTVPTFNSYFSSDVSNPENRTALISRSGGRGILFV